MDAAQVERIKDLLPTGLGTEEIRSEIAADILRRSVLSARTENAAYLARIRDVCAQISAGEINQARARELLLVELERMGHSPLDGGGLRNPASIRRLNLVVDTQAQMAASVSRLMGQDEATVRARPAWRLERTGGRRAPRQDWPARWAAAGEPVGWEGALRGADMVALKSSPIWQALGDGVGGFRDALGNPYPPFAFSSGLSWTGVPRAECVALGLVSEDEATQAPERPSLSPRDKDILAAVDRLGFSLEDLAGGLQ